MGRNGLTWISRDDRARAEHEPLLNDAVISTVWIRGLGRLGKKGRVPERNRIRLKHILFMLVNKLDEIQYTIETSLGPRHFLLYLNERSNRAEARPYTTLREVGEALANPSGRS